MSYVEHFIKLMEKACTYKTGVGTDFFAQDVRIAENVTYIGKTYHMQISGSFSDDGQLTITVTVGDKEDTLTPFLAIPRLCETIRDRVIQAIVRLIHA